MTDDGSCGRDVVKLAIMQPYFFPYIGYFQLIAAVDMFIIYDNIKYTKKGWINRNRMLLNGKDVMFSLPLKKDSDFLDVVQRQLASDFDREKLLNQFKGAYGRAPYFEAVFPTVQNVLGYEDQNLFRYICNSIVGICAYLGITTTIGIASEMDIDHRLKAQQKVLALCEAAGTDTYVNAIGGLDLYSRSEFAGRGIDLKFIKSTLFDYPQFEHPFVPWLSIIDVLMFNPRDVVRSRVLTSYEMV